jgi:hypothetical protein
MGGKLFFLVALEFPSTGYATSTTKSLHSILSSSLKRWQVIQLLVHMEADWDQLARGIVNMCPIFPDGRGLGAEPLVHHDEGVDGTRSVERREYIVDETGILKSEVVGIRHKRGPFAHSAVHGNQLPSTLRVVGMVAMRKGIQWIRWRNPAREIREARAHFTFGRLHIKNSVEGGSMSQVEVQIPGGIPEESGKGGQAGQRCLVFYIFKPRVYTSRDVV